MSVRGETTGHPILLPTRDQIEHRRGRDGANYLRDDAGNDIDRFEAASRPQSDSNSAIRMSARGVSHRIRHGQHGQTEGQRDITLIGAVRCANGPAHPGAPASRGLSVKSLRSRRDQPVLLKKRQVRKMLGLCVNHHAEHRSHQTRYGIVAHSMDSFPEYVSRCLPVMLSASRDKSLPKVAVRISL
jgi:hypothetical protein